MTEEFDVVVIGGGTAGLVTASGCARLGRRVALIDREALGGDCLWTGCVPTKALVASAKLAHSAAHADMFGFEPATLQFSPRRVMESMRERRRLIEPHDAPQKFIALGIDVIHGNAKLVGDMRVIVGERTLRAKDIVVATGSRTAIPPVQGLESSRYIDHRSFLEQDELPRSVIILGGGAIGIEFAQIFRRLGSSVTVVEKGESIIPREDDDVIAGVRAVLESEGVEIRTGWSALTASRSADESTVVIERDGTRETLRAEAIFVAAGRRGNIEELGLEDAGVATDRSYIKVDPFLRTTAPNVWACGDVHGGLQFTHVAAYEAVKLVRNLLFPGRSAVSYEHIPWAVFTDPEVARVGLTEREARAKHGDDVRVYRVEMHDVDRAVVDRAGLGFLKVIASTNGTILGAHAFSAGASTLLQQIVATRRAGGKVADLAATVSPYPSLADSIGKIGSQYYQQLNDTWKGALARRIAALTHR